MARLRRKRGEVLYWIRTAELLKLEPLCSMRFSEVSYDGEAAAKSMREQFLSAASTMAKKWLAPNGQCKDALSINPSKFYEVNNDIVESVAPLLKSKAFKDEEEWRLWSIQTDNGINKNELAFRPGRSYLVPYIKVTLCSLKNPIASIRVGPTPHVEEAVSAVRRMVVLNDKRGLIDHRTDAWSSVQPSAVPYRDW